LFSITLADGFCRLGENRRGDGGGSEFNLVTGMSGHGMEGEGPHIDEEEHSSAAGSSLACAGSSTEHI